jgi:N-acetylglucosamine kinase-like BadF-type ATPase
MVLVADSGSTKTDWLISKDSEVELKHTMGFNPFFHSTDLVYNELNKNENLTQLAPKVKKVFYYGAGCSSDERNNIIKKALDRFFVNAIEIVVEHDLLAAALATCNDQKGISCIIGTGSNSCYFDGKEVHEEVPALGYVLGDEGSGAFIGKRLVTDWLYNKMPIDLHQKLKEKFNLSKEEIFNRVYNLPNPNVYLAHFMVFAREHIKYPYLRDVVYNALATFANIHIWCYPVFREVPVHFVGSIAYYFQDILREVAKNHNFKVGNIERKPIHPLLKYHLKKEASITT